MTERVHHSLRTGNSAAPAGSPDGPMNQSQQGTLKPADITGRSTLEDNNTARCGGPSWSTSCFCSFLAFLVQVRR